MLVNGSGPRVNVGPLAAESDAFSSGGGVLSALLFADDSVGSFVLSSLTGRSPIILGGHGCCRRARILAHLDRDKVSEN